MCPRNNWNIVLFITFSKIQGTHFGTILTRVVPGSGCSSGLTNRRLSMFRGHENLNLISKFNKKLKEGLKLEDAITATGMSRFRPIVLTSITTIAGLAPLIFEKELQAQFLIPMAIAISYGLILATLLTLVFLPAFLKIVNKIRFTKEWIFTGKKLNNEEREPAIKELEYEKL